jgi:hypothetical protein
MPHNLYSSLYVIKAIKKNKITGHIACIGENKKYISNFGLKISREGSFWENYQG